MNKYDLVEPPAINPEIGDAKSCIFYDKVSFICLCNRFALFELRLDLWYLATSLSFGEDVGIYSDNCDQTFGEAIAVPYCEITLISGDQPTGRFLKVKQNYLYRPEDRRVDFSVVRSEARKAFLNTEAIQAGDQKIELFSNLWLKIVDDI